VFYLPLSLLTLQIPLFRMENFSDFTTSLSYASESENSHGLSKYILEWKKSPDGRVAHLTYAPIHTTSTTQSVINEHG
jgi:hypothetical protein